MKLQRGKNIPRAFVGAGLFVMALLAATAAAQIPPLKRRIVLEVATPIPPPPRL